MSSIRPNGSHRNRNRSRYRRRATREGEPRDAGRPKHQKDVRLSEHICHSSVSITPLFSPSSVQQVAQRLSILHGCRSCRDKKYTTIYRSNVCPCLPSGFNPSIQYIHSLFNALLLLYAVIQIGEIKEVVQNANGTSGGISDIPINVLTVIIPCVIAAAELAFIGLGWKIYHEFGWKVYKFLGADRRIKKLYANYQIYECLIKFDVFFFAGFSVQFLWLVLNSNDWEYYVTIAALPLSIVLLVEGHYAAKHENKWMMATFMSGCVGAMVYFIYKVCTRYSPVDESHRFL